MLWTRGSVLREGAVRLHNGYGTIRAAPERMLVGALLAPAEQPIDGDVPGWLEATWNQLAERQYATVSIRLGDRGRLSQVLRSAVLNPVSIQFFNLYPSVRRVLREADRLLVHHELKKLL